MSSISVVQAPTNGKKSQPTKPKRPSLAERVDELHRLRALIRDAVTAERALTAEVMAALEAAHTDRAEGARSVAKIAPRETTTVDVALFLEALGERAYPALDVQIETARGLLAGDDLAAISETSSVRTLRVEAKKNGPVTP